MTTLEIAPDHLVPQAVVPADHAPPGNPSPPTPGKLRRWRPRTPTRSGWITGAIGALAAALYTWNLSAVGMGNGYYAAAVKSGTVSWKAFFFGSIDAGSFITVDKPPAVLWLQELSGRLFGFGTWSMLLPEAIAGVASVLLLHHMVRKWMGDVAAHIAALAFAVTPVALMMFRYNNPDALLTLLCLAAAAALWSALETGRTRMLVLSGALMGLAFESKMLQAFLVLPAFVLVYLWAGKPKLGKRLAQLSAALATLVISASWWVAIVALWPAASRPYIGSTQNNNILSLVFGYNGLSRIFGSSPAGGGAGGGGSSGFGGASGVLRMFNDSNAGGISWLLPLAGVGLLAGMWLTRRYRRTDLRRAGWLLWGGWALVSLVVFSLSSGIFHQYYTIQLAPAVAALAGAGGLTLWRLGRQHRWLRPVLPLTILATAAWAVVVLDRVPAFAPWLRTLVIIGAVASAGLIWLGDQLRHRGIVLAAAILAGVTLLAGPVAYSLTTAAHPTTGSILTAGPSSATSAFAGPGAGGGESSAADSALVSYLEEHQGSARYLVAAFGSGSSDGIIIATGKPVITIGGFNGGDPAPTLAQFKHLVATGQVRYVLVSSGGGGFGGGPGGGNSSISSWVTSVGRTVSYGGSGGTLYEVSATA